MMFPRAVGRGGEGEGEYGVKIQRAGDGEGQDGLKIERGGER